MDSMGGKFLIPNFPNTSVCAHNLLRKVKPRCLTDSKIQCEKQIYLDGILTTRNPATISEKQQLFDSFVFFRDELLLLSKVSLLIRIRNSSCCLNLETVLQKRPGNNCLMHETLEDLKVQVHQYEKAGGFTQADVFFK